MSSSPDDSLYFIPANTREQDRLSRQYTMKKSYSGWTSAVPPSIDLTQVSDVLDIGAGTCVWILDVAHSPEIHPRLDTPTSEPAKPGVNLYACDINTGFFPAASITDKLGIKTFQQDVTKPFPAELYGKFDLVHASMLVFCLKLDGWRAALDNCQKLLSMSLELCDILSELYTGVLLEPGGLLMWDESDPVFYVESNPLPSLQAATHDFDKCMSGNDWVQKGNCIYTKYALVNEFIADLSYRLPSLMEEAGLQIVDSERLTGAFGPLCRTHKGLGDTSLAEYEEFSVECIKLVLEYQASILMQNKTLEAPIGIPITTEEGMKSLMEELVQGFRSMGALMIGRYCVAKKI